LEFKKFPSSWSFRAEGLDGEAVPRAAQAILANWAAFYPDLAGEYEASEKFWDELARQGLRKKWKGKDEKTD
jgi:hypothetical protein